MPATKKVRGAKKARGACGGGGDEEGWCVLTEDANEATERALDRRRADRALQVVEIVLVRREVLARVGSDAVFVRLVRLPTRQVRASSGAAKVRGGWAGGGRGSRAATSSAKK